LYDRSFAILIFQEDACDGIILNIQFLDFILSLVLQKQEFLYHYQNRMP